MCGRFTREFSWREVHDFLDLKWPSAAEMLPSYNVAPTQPIAVCRVGRDGERELVPMRWGLVPRWSKDPNKGWINARSETAATSPAFRDAFAHRRCLVPASGFYEWKTADGKGKRPFYIRLKDDPIFCFGGLWERWGENEGAFESATILTTRPNGLMAEVHDRMPVILRRPDLGRWLGLGTPNPSLLEPLSQQLMRMHEVGRRVNRPGADGRALTEPAEPEPPGLFGAEH